MPDDQGTATPEQMLRLLHAGDAERMATAVSVAIADLLLQPKEDRCPMVVAISDALLPHVERIRSTTRSETEGRVYAELFRRVSPAIDAVITEAAVGQAQGVMATAMRSHLHHIADDVLKGKEPEGLK